MKQKYIMETELQHFPRIQSTASLTMVNFKWKMVARFVAIEIKPLATTLATVIDWGIPLWIACCLEYDVSCMDSLYTLGITVLNSSNKFLKKSPCIPLSAENIHTSIMGYGHERSRFIVKVIIFRILFIFIYIFHKKTGNEKKKKNPQESESWEKRTKREGIFMWARGMNSKKKKKQKKKHDVMASFYDDMMIKKTNSDSFL